MDWISWVVQDGEDLSERVEVWFSRLSLLYPDNPFVLLYWGDALNVVTTAKHGELMSFPDAQLWDPVADKYKEAYALDSELSVAAIRAQGITLPTAYPLRNTALGDPCPACGIPPDDALEPGAYEVLWDAVPGLREAQEAGTVIYCPQCGRQLTFGEG